MRVVVNVAALAGRLFDYVVPEPMQPDVRVGTVVRVPLQGRRVRAWVVELADHAATERRLLPIAKVSSVGPGPEVVDLAAWAAWRWAGPVTRFLGTASPAFAVRGLPGGGDRWPEPVTDSTVTVARVAPSGDSFAWVERIVARGDALVLAPSLTEAAIVAARLRRAGAVVAEVPRDWARAAAGGCTVVGARAAAWAPVPRLAGVVVIDEHDEVYQEERAPTWHARDVVIERARRAGVPCVLTSPCPSLDALSMPAARLVMPDRTAERGGWPVLEVVDRRDEPPGAGLYPSRFVELVRNARPGERVVCVLNRKGRVVLSACASCQELARCERCDGPQETTGEGALRCRRCGAEQPMVCRHCGNGRFKALRVGVARVREEVELLSGQPVAEITGDGRAGPPPSAAVLVGTVAVLHRLAGARVVVFLDFDQELLAPRYRAGEEALALLARAGRLVGGRDESPPGRVVVQTRLPRHEVLDAALHGDPGRLAVVESARRAALRLPPETALARISGPGAVELVAGLAGLVGIEVIGPAGDRWLVRAVDHQVLGDALAAAPRPAERARVEVDPLRA